MFLILCLHYTWKCIIGVHMTNTIPMCLKTHQPVSLATLSGCLVESQTMVIVLIKTVVLVSRANRLAVLALALTVNQSWNLTLYLIPCNTFGLNIQNLSIICCIGICLYFHFLVAEKCCSSIQIHPSEWQLTCQTKLQSLGCWTNCVQMERCLCIRHNSLLPLNGFIIQLLKLYLVYTNLF